MFKLYNEIINNKFKNITAVLILKVIFFIQIMIISLVQDDAHKIKIDTLKFYFYLH